MTNALSLATMATELLTKQLSHSHRLSNHWDLFEWSWPWNRERLQWVDWGHCVNFRAENYQCIYQNPRLCVELSCIQKAHHF